MGVVCVVMVYFVTTLLNIFHTMCRWKKYEIGQYLAKIWTKVCCKAYVFEPPCINRRKVYLVGYNSVADNTGLSSFI